MRNFEEVLRRKDGSPVHVLINCFAVRDPDGQVLQYRGLLLDVSGLRQSQTELQRERDFSNQILNHTQSLILVTGTDWCDQLCQPPLERAGIRTEPVAGSFSPGTDGARPPAPRCAKPWRRSPADSKWTTSRCNCCAPMARAASFSVNLSPISGDDGRVSSIVVVMTDVTDSAMLQAKLIHTEKMAAVGQLVSGVAHEVNNPLTAILGFTDLLMESHRSAGDAPAAICA